MVFQKMMRIRGWLIGRGRSSLIVALLWAAFGIKAAGCDMLEIIYPSASLILKEGDPLTLNCTVWHEQKQSSDLKIHNISRSDSGSYQCRASANNQTAVGHYIRVKVTGSPEAISQGSKTPRMDFWLEKTWALIMILWLTLS
ncbi:uncharacterized protein LOC120396111 isoform X5 [Mauremys reevesii]|uniref:uncharacterized protein LOC120396111 isoform X5 n=1 Tax=Mauremys reevesii TaxID=260615 RepID=UPI00193FAF51|nr:uncharacterized protein LOC120396111 isoform X5 [Mauremys reevesii]